jgi:hypothetical protein
LKISLPDEEKELEVLGEVAWFNKEERVKFKETLPSGLGIKFLKLFQDKRTKKELLEF